MAKMLKLRRPDTCCACAAELPAGADGWWDSSTNTVRCVACHGFAVVEKVAAETAFNPATAGQIFPGSPAAPIDRGIGGASAQATYVEQALARHLARDLLAPIVVLHDRKVPRTRGNIDHLIVSSGGVWIVDAKNYKGKVERRDVGNWRTTEIELFVNGRNRMKAVNGMWWQVDAVRAALAGSPFADLPIHPALCFTNSKWPLLAKPGKVGGVWILWAKKLVQLVSEPGELDDAAIDAAARLLSGRLPAVVSASPSA